MTDPEAITFFETFAAYFTGLTEEAKAGWAQWLNRKDVTLAACLRILEGLKEQDKKPRLPQFQARFIQERNLAAYHYDRGCARCKLRGKSTGWLQALYGMKALWEMKFYKDVPVDERNWFKIWPSEMVDPRDKRDEAIHQYYQLHAVPCNCRLGDSMLEREIKADRPPYPREEHLRISTTLAMTHAEAATAIVEFQALAVKKYGLEATKAQTFPGLFQRAGGLKEVVTTGGMFDDEEEVVAPARFQFPEKKPSPVADGLKPGEPENVHWEDLEIPI